MSRRWMMLTGSAVAIGLLTGLSGILYAEFKSFQNRRQVLQGEYAGRYIASANRMIRAGNPEQARRRLQDALAVADNAGDRIDAASLLVDILLSPETGRSRENLIEAQTYLDGILTIENRPANRLQVLQRQLEVAGRLNDLARVVRVAAEAEVLAETDAQRNALLSVRIESVIRAGRWQDVQPLFPALDARLDDPAWGLTFRLHRAGVYRRCIRDTGWREGWTAAWGSSVDAGLVPALLRDLALQDLAIVRSSPSRLHVETATFQMAQVYFESGDVEPALDMLQNFLRLEPERYYPEALLLMTRIARKQDKAEQAMEMFQLYLYRYPWNSAARDELLDVLRLSRESGLLEESAELVERYLHRMQDREPDWEVLESGAQLAAELKRWDRARDYYWKILTGSLLDSQRTSAMLGLAGVERGAGNLPMASYWLMRFLQRFPFDRRGAEACFVLLEILQETGAPVMEQLQVALRAVARAPNDIRSVRALFTVAEKLEQFGMWRQAQQQYAKVALLAYIEPRATAEQVDVPSLVSRAMLGNARCLLQGGDFLRADRLLRDLCNVVQIEPVRSEAAYWWAKMAVSDRQRIEANRRLSLVDSNAIDRALWHEIKAEGMILDLPMTDAPVGQLTDILALVSDVETVKREDLVRRAYDGCVERLLELDAEVDLSALFRTTATGQYARVVSLNHMHLAIGNHVFRKHGSGALVRRFHEHSGMMANCPVDPATWSRLTGLAAEIDTGTQRVKGFQ